MWMVYTWVSSAFYGGGEEREKEREKLLRGLWSPQPLRTTPSRPPEMSMAFVPSKRSRAMTPQMELNY